MLLLLSMMIFGFLLGVYLKYFNKLKYQITSMFSKVNDNIKIQPSKTLILNYYSSNYKDICDTLAVVNDTKEIVILFIGPEWLYNIKKKQLSKFTIIHSSEVNVKDLINYKDSFVIFSSGKKKYIVNEVVQFLKVTT